VAESRVSVVMPTFNRASFIVDALDSLARQTRRPEEVIVVDDQSTDGTAKCVREHAFSERIRYHRQPERRGASVARNTGVELATGDVIVFLDSDDVLEPGHNEIALKVLNSEPTTALYCCDSRVIGPSGESLADSTWTTIQCEIKGRRISSGLRSLTDILLFSTPFPGMTVRTSVYRAVGGLDQDLFPLDDYDFQLRVAGRDLGVYYDHEPLARYRVHGTNESGVSNSIRVGMQKLRCVELTWGRYPQVRALGRRYTQRRGEVRRELSISLLRAGRVGAGLLAMARSLCEDPAGLRDLARIAARRFARSR
jgi:glycosyltransferase involved in cell wall biosynthesis